jgi:hypothetical protein
VIERTLAKSSMDPGSTRSGRASSSAAAPHNCRNLSERVDTFRQSEVTGNAMMIPYSVSRYFTGDASVVVSLTRPILKVIQSRHRPGSNYVESNKTSLH